MPESTPAQASKNRRNVAVLGTGPAGLMAATVLAEAGHRVTLFEKRRGAGRKLLIAGSSGLNITYDAPAEEFAAHYGGPDSQVRRALELFPPSAWIAFIESLGIKAFKGTSRRWFVEGMKASALLKAWLARLESLGARVETGKECVSFEALPGGGVRLGFAGADGDAPAFDAACFCLGGGSYEPQEDPLRWPAIFARKGLAFTGFEAANVGFQVAWPEALLAEAEGLPIKNVVLASSRASRAGDLVITRYGIEGTPVYFAGEKGIVRIDLKPGLGEERVLERLRSSRENLSPMRRVKKLLNLGEGALALVFHLAPERARTDLAAMAAAIKAFPLELVEKQPLSEAISSIGGLGGAELDASMMLRGHPGVFAAGEMLDWHAPTGGFLIQGCVSQGRLAGEGMVSYLAGLDRG